VLDKLGEPYVTTRPNGEGSRTGHAGMGLGFFIAKTLLEQSGATVTFRNGRRGGAVVCSCWPRAELERSPPGQTAMQSLS
jgi:two-component system sensor histidine kinase RegB